MIPWYVYLIGGILIFGSGSYAGYSVTNAYEQNTIKQMKLDDAKAVIAAQQAAVADQKARDAVTGTVSVQAARDQQKAFDQANLLPQRITKYVTVKGSANVVLPNGFTKLLDAYALGTDPDALPNAANEPNDAPSGVSLSQASALLATNLNICHLARQRDADWAKWATDQQSLNQK